MPVARQRRIWESYHRPAVRERRSEAPAECHSAPYGDYQAL